jgi:methionyl-tRNA synthetase
VDRPEAEHVALQARVLATAAEAIRIITALVYPILPESAAKVWLQLGQGEIAAAAHSAFLTEIAWGGLRAGTKFGEPAPLFPRAEKDAVERMQKIEEQNSLSVIEAAGGNAVSQNEPAANSKPSPQAAAPAVKTAIPAPAAKIREKEAIVSEETEKQKSWDKVPVDSIGVQAEDEALAYETVAQASVPVPTEPAAAPPAPTQVAATQEPQHITIDDFIKVDLRVAQILVAERVPKADKLLRLEVDLGYEKRQILAGIAQYYEPEKLIGRKIVIVANLAPRKMRGLESNGMLLAASLEDGAPVLAGFLEDAPLGARLK